jgi:hypothetical protein
VSLFADHVRRWHAALVERRADEAHWAAGELLAVGRLLTIDAEFQRLYEHHRSVHQGAKDAEAALRSLCAFLHAVADTTAPGSYRAPRTRN